MADDTSSECGYISTEDFKRAVQDYVSIHDKLAEIRKETTVLNKRKKKLGETIVSFMKSNNKDFCNLGDNGILELKTSKSSLSLKKDQVIKLLQQYGDNEKRANEVAEFLFTNKEVRERDVIKRSLRTVD